MKRTFIALVATALVALGLPLAVAGPAAAHTPARTATCSGVTVTGTSYESGDTNTLGIKIDDGAWTTKSFSTSGTLTVPVPQDGSVHSYAAYVHTTNSNAGYSKDYSGSVGPCGDQHVSATPWEKTDPTCGADGALVPKAQPAGVTASQSPAGTGPGPYTITFAAQDGYAIDGPTSQSITVLARVTGDDCATIVQPVAPTLTQPTCTGPGTGTPGSFTLPGNGNGLTYTESAGVVTATADADHKFVSLPDGWSWVDAHHATFAINYAPPADYPACLGLLPVPAAPASVAPTCDTDGSMTVAPVEHVLTEVDGTPITEETVFGPGEYAITYTADAGHTFAGGTTADREISVSAMTLDCPATPVAPTITQPACSGPGTSSDLVVVFGDVEGDHIGYSYDEQAHLVTATAEAGFALVDLPEGWVAQPDGTADYQVAVLDPGACLETIDVPAELVPTVPSCDVDGALTVLPTEHVVTEVDGTLLTEETSFGPGSHEISYSAAPGYTFAGGTEAGQFVEVAAMTMDCPASPAAPRVTQPSCTALGGSTEPVVTYTAADHVTYSYEATGALSGIVTAVADLGYLFSGADSGWTMQEDGSATYPVTFTDPGLCTVTAVEPPTTSTPQEEPQGGAPATPSTLPNTGAPQDLGLLAGEAALLLLLGCGRVGAQSDREVTDC